MRETFYYSKKGEGILFHLKYCVKNHHQPFELRSPGIPINFSYSYHQTDNQYKNLINMHSSSLGKRGGKREPKRPITDLYRFVSCPIEKRLKIVPKYDIFGNPIQGLNDEPANATQGFNAATEDNNQADLVLTSTSIPLLPRDCKFLLLDIEGCTTAISFVHDVLFPFARSHADEYLKQLKDEQEVTEILHSLRKDVEALPSDHPTLNYLEALKDDNSTELEEVKRIVVGLMSHDVKATGKCCVIFFQSFVSGPTLFVYSSQVNVLSLVV